MVMFWQKTCMIPCAKRHHTALWARPRVHGFAALECCWPGHVLLCAVSRCTCCRRRRASAFSASVHPLIFPDASEREPCLRAVNARDPASLKVVKLTFDQPIFAEMATNDGEMKKGMETAPLRIERDCMNRPLILDG